MKIKAIVLICAALSFAGCGAKTVTVGSPTTPPSLSGVVIAADAVEVACAAAAVDVSPTVAAWLAECPGVVTTTVNALESTSATSAATIIVTGLNQFLALAPSTGISTQDLTIIKSITAAVAQLIAIYQQQVATAANYVPPAWADSFLAVSKWAPSKADKKKLAEIKKAAKKLAKRFPKKKN